MEHLNIGQKTTVPYTITNKKNFNKEIQQTLKNIF